MKIPPSGILKTSDDPIHTVKFQRAEYFYYSGSARYPLDTQENLGGGGTVGKLGENGTYTDISFRFWVGTQKEYQQYNTAEENVKDDPEVK